MSLSINNTFNLHVREVNDVILKHPEDIAAYLNHSVVDSVVGHFSNLNIKTQVDVMGYLSKANQVRLASALPREQIVSIISCMRTDERADFYNRMPGQIQGQLLPVLAYAEREDIRLLASYEEGTAGSIMTSDYVSISPELTPIQAITALRRCALNAETIYTIYVVDEQEKLLGAISLQDLILASSHSDIGSLISKDIISVTIDTDQKNVSRIVGQYDLMTVPVINDKGILLGIITHDDIYDVVTQETTDDMQKGDSIGKLSISIKEASVGLLYKKRAVWLVLLVFGNIFSGAGIAYFEEVIASYVALVFFLPLLIDSGGNAGAQSSTLMVRALATGEVEVKDWSEMLGREIFVSLFLGLSMAAAVSVLGLYRGGLEIAMVVGSSMVSIVIVGSLVGTLLPFILHRLNLEPASASAPIITSVADISGVLIYFAIARSLLPLN